MPLITIGSTPIQFPDTAQSPDWSEAIIQFAQAVAESLNTVAGPYDVPAQSFIFNSTGTQDIPSLQFSSSLVRAAYIKYSIYRTTSSSSAYEAGQAIVIYSSNNPVGNKWDLIVEKVQGGPSGPGGSSSITLSITDDGQMQLTATALAGSNAINKISYSAQAFTQ